MHNNEKDCIEELIEKEFKVKDYSLNSGKTSKNIVGAILKA
jgi:hypothetical protein